MFYKYKVGYYDSYTDDEPTDEGILWGESYEDAATKLIADYGKDNVIDIYLYEICIDSDYCLSKDELDHNFTVH